MVRGEKTMVCEGERRWVLLKRETKDDVYYVYYYILPPNGPVRELKKKNREWRGRGEREMLWHVSESQRGADSGSSSCFCVCRRAPSAVLSDRLARSCRLHSRWLSTCWRISAHRQFVCVRVAKAFGFETSSGSHV